MHTIDPGSSLKSKFYLRLATCLASLLLWLLMMMNCFCRMTDQRNALSFISSWVYCRKFPPSQSSDMPGADFKPAWNSSSGFAQQSCVVVIITRQLILYKPFIVLYVTIILRLIFSENSKHNLSSVQHKTLQLVVSNSVFLSYLNARWLFLPCKNVLRDNLSK